MLILNAVLWHSLFALIHMQTQDFLGSMQTSIRKLNLHTILQNYPLWCCCHVMYKLPYPSIRVRTVPPVSLRVRVSFSFTV